MSQVRLRVGVRALVLGLALVLPGCVGAPDPAPTPGPAEDVLLPAAVVTTDLGAFTMILYEEAAPMTVANFVGLARDGFFDGVTFHRVIDGFVIQTGDPTGTGTGGSLETVAAEPGLHFAAGAVGMARDQDPDSATSQWFVCEYPQPHLHDPPPSSTYGAFTAWAQVVEGMEVVKAIEEVATLNSERPSVVPSGVLPDRPVQDVRILGVEVVDLALPADVADRYPLRTTPRWITDDHRTTLELFREVRAGEPSTLTWYATPRTPEAAPPRDVSVTARAPEGATADLPTARSDDDPFVLLTRTSFPTAGTWNLTLADGSAVLAQFDVEVRP